MMKVNSADTCHIKPLLKYLEKIYGVAGDYLLDDESLPKCMFFQDSLMKDMFNFYPDRIAIDCSFKKFEIDLHMLIILCEDSNGRNFIVAVGFLQNKEIDSLGWLFETFKKHNPNWRKIRSLAVDPGIEHFDLVTETFSSSFIIICSYHAVKAFKIYLNNANAFKTVSEEQKNCSVDLFKNILYTSTNSEFEVQLQKYQTLPENFITYLSEVWLSLKLQWRIPLDLAHEDVFKCRNEYLEELNNAIQMIFEFEKNYVAFIKKVFLLILLQKREKPSKILEPVPILYSRCSPEYQICKSLTPYAAEFVIKQLDLSQEMIKDFNPLSKYTFNYFDMKIQACATSCQCNFYRCTLMPCRHIFCVRKINNLSLFDGSNFDSWNRQYYEHASLCMEDYLTRCIDSHIPQDLDSRTTLASHLFEITTQLLLDSPRNVYDSRIKVIKNLIQPWDKDEDVSVKFIGIEKFLKKGDYHISNDSNLVKKNEIIPTSEMVYRSSKIHSCQEDKLSDTNASLSKLQEKEHFNMDTNSCNPNQKSLALPQEPKRLSRQRLCSTNHCLLNDRHINLAYVISIICSTKESSVNWLKARGFLPTSMKCSSCSGEMLSKNLSRLNDGVSWRCSDKKCMGKKSSVRLGTWFEESNLTLQQTLIFIYMWLNNFSKARILFEMSISAVNYVKWDKFLQRVCDESLNGSSADSQVGPSIYKDPLHKWLENHVRKDTFLEFLKDAAYVYRKNKEKHQFDLKS